MKKESLKEHFIHKYNELVKKYGKTKVVIVALILLPIFIGFGGLAWGLAPYALYFYYGDKINKIDTSKILTVLKNYPNNIVAGFKTNENTSGFKGLTSRFTNLWKYSLDGKITIIAGVIILVFLFVRKPPIEELTEEWYLYSIDLLEAEMTSIMSQKDNDGEYIYPKFFVHNFTEWTGNMPCKGKLIHKFNGDGQASISCPNYSNATEIGYWRMQLAPTKFDPKNSFVVFRIQHDYKFSTSIGERNIHFTPLEEFLNFYSKEDAQRFTDFSDSIRNVYMNKWGLTRGPDGSFVY